MIIDIIIIQTYLNTHKKGNYKMLKSKNLLFISLIVSSILHAQEKISIL